MRPVMAESSERATVSSLSYGKISCYTIILLYTEDLVPTRKVHVFEYFLWLMLSVESTLMPHTSYLR